MYVCNCQGITESEVRGAIDLGCRSLDDLRRELGVATGCGRCAKDARRLIRGCGQARARTNSPCAGSGD